MSTLVSDQGAPFIAVIEQAGVPALRIAFTRRSFLGTAAAAAGGFTALQKVVGADRSKTDPGPANKELDAQNPDSIWPPATDSKSLVQNFKYPFSFANKRTYEG